MSTMHLSYDIEIFHIAGKKITDTVQYTCTEKQYFESGQMLAFFSILPNLGLTSGMHPMNRYVLKQVTTNQIHELLHSMMAN